MKILIKLILVSSIILNAGCGTILTRIAFKDPAFGEYNNYDGKKIPVYRGTAEDIWWMSGFIKESPIVVIPITLVTIPIDFSFDTLFLPVDIAYIAYESVKPSNVVDFLPDKFEDDDDFTTTNTIIPGDEPQEHSLHNGYDKDFLRLDLTGVTAGDIVQITTDYLSVKTYTRIQIYNNNQNPLLNTISDNIIDDNKCDSLVLFVCNNPDKFFIEVNERCLNTGDYSITAINTGSPIKINSTNISPAIAGCGYNERLIATGSSNEYNYTTANLPASLVIDKESGIIAGSLNVDSGQYVFTLTVSDKNFPAKKTSKDFTLNVFRNLQISTVNVPNVLRESPYSTQISAIGGSGHFQFSAINLPSGLTINSAGLISGDVTASSGDYQFIARVTDTEANVTVEKVLNLSIIDFWVPQNM